MKCPDCNFDVEPGQPCQRCRGGGGNVYSWPHNPPPPVPTRGGDEAERRKAFWLLQQRDGGFPLCDLCENSGLAVQQRPHTETNPEPFETSKLARERGWKPVITGPTTTAHSCDCPRGRWLREAYRNQGITIAEVWYVPEGYERKRTGAYAKQGLTTAKERHAARQLELERRAGKVAESKRITDSNAVPNDRQLGKQEVML